MVCLGNAFLNDFAVSVPDTFITNSEMASLASCDSAELLKYTAVEKKPVETQSIVARAAKLSTILAERVSRENISHVIFGTTHPEDKTCWYASSAIIRELGLSDVHGFDISHGCNSLILALDLANLLITSDRAKGVLIVVADLLSQLIDYGNPVHRCIFNFSDGAGAAFVSTEPRGYRVVDFSFSTVADQADTVFLRRKEEKIWMNDDREEDKALVEIYRQEYVRHILAVTERHNLKPGNIAKLFMNQGDHKLIHYLEDALKLKKDTIVRSHREFGHVGNSDILLNLEQNKKTLVSGDKIVFAASALGYSFSAALLEVL